MVNRLESDATTLKNNIDRLEESLYCADENGLFKDNKKDDYSQLVHVLVEAFMDLETFNNQDDKNKKTEPLSQAWEKYRAVHHQLNQAINSARFSWRFKYLFGGPFIIYLILLLAIAFTGWFSYPDSFNSQVLGAPVYAYLWGFIGGILQGLWFLWQHLSYRRFRKVWIPWYLTIPFMGAILGALTYFIFLAGFFATTGTAKVESGAFIILLCAIAGFSTRWAVETLDDITKLIKIGK